MADGLLKKRVNKSQKEKPPVQVAPRFPGTNKYTRCKQNNHFMSLAKLNLDAKSNIYVPG